MVPHMSAKDEMKALLEKTHTTITFSTTMAKKFWLQQVSKLNGHSVSETCGTIISDFIDKHSKQNLNEKNK